MRWLAGLGGAGLAALRSSPSVPLVGGLLPLAAVRRHAARWRVVVLGDAGVVRVHDFKAPWLPSAAAWACRAVSLLGVAWCATKDPAARARQISTDFSSFNGFNNTSKPTSKCQDQSDEAASAKKTC